MEAWSDSHHIDEAMRALAHTSRRAIIRLTADRGIPATELAEMLNVAPATASEHLKVLRKTELVVLTAEGTWRRYRANLPQVDAVLDAVAHDLARQPPTIKELAP